MTTGSPRSAAEPRDPRLCVLVQVVVLNLAEVPVVSVQEPQEVRRVAVVGKADVADRTRRLLGRDPVLDAERLEPLPLRDVGHVMQQVIVHMVGAQARELLVEEAVQRFAGADHVLGQLGRDVDLVAQAVPRQDRPQGGFAAGIEVGGVEVVDPEANGLENLSLRLLYIHAAALAAEPHAAVAEDGEGLAIAIFSVLHGLQVGLHERGGQETN